MFLKNRRNCKCDCETIELEWDLCVCDCNCKGHRQLTPKSTQEINRQKEFIKKAIARKNKKQTIKEWDW